MRNRLQHVCLAALLGAAAPPAGAAITPLNSAFFVHKTEMNDGGNLSTSGDTTDWHRSEGDIVAGETFNSLSNGVLTYTTGIHHGYNNLRWDSKLYTPSAVTPQSGETWEVKVQAISSITIANPFSGATFGITPGINANTWIRLLVKTTGTYYSVNDSLNGVLRATAPILLDSNVNTDAEHVFRLTRDASSQKWQIWRDSAQIGTDIQGGSVGHYGLQMGDSLNDWSGSAAVDYVRWTAGAYSPAPMPEPAGLALAALGGAVILRRRRK